MNKAPTHKQPLISIVTACYNTEFYARDMIKSVAGQRYENWELIIVDDHSADNSVEVCRRAIKEFRIEDKAQVLVQSRNRGYGYTLWNAIKHSTGQLIAVLDIDDALYGDDVLSIAAKTHLKYPDIALTYSDYLECDVNLNPVNVYHTRQLLDDEQYISTKIRINHLKVFKRIFYESTEGVNKKLRQTVDKDLVLKLEEIGKLKHIPQVLYAYRKHDQNISRTIKDKAYQEKIDNTRHKIYSAAHERRKKGQPTWLSLEKCLALQERWGDYDKFVRSPNHPNKKEVIKVLKKTVSRFQEPPTVLEVGCGTGHFMWTIKSKVSGLYGVDISPHMLVLTENQFLNSAITPVLRRGTCWKLPFKDNSVDVVYQVDVCMHVGDSWKSILEMLRVAKRFIIFTGPSFEELRLINIDEKFPNGKRWQISIPLLIEKLNELKANGTIKTYELKHRDRTETYKHKILVIEK